MIKTENQKNTSTHQATYDLIRGTFSAEEAKEIIHHMIRKKINFHEVRNFSKEIRFGQKDEQSAKRIKELQSTIEHLDKLLEEGKNNNQTIRIASTISIELI